MAFAKDDPDFNWIEFDFKSVPDRFEEFKDIMDAVNPNLDKFKKYNNLSKEIRKIGLYQAMINLHAEIQATIHIEVVKQEEEK